MERTKAVAYKHLKITSTAFEDGEYIPEDYTCDGENINPPLDISHIPTGTVCLAVIVEDADAPFHTWTHWIAWNIHTTKHIKERRRMEAEGVNDFDEVRYCGPCPISGAHRYCFKVYALDSLLNLPEHATRMQLEKAMADHIVGFGELTGVYQKADR